MTAKNTEIEALRGVAIAMVLMAHFIGIAPWHTPAVWVLVTQNFKFGYGVDLFFVISGYVVSKSLLGTSTATAPTIGDLKSFFVKRAFRVLPTSFFWIAATLLLTITFNRFKDFGVLGSNLREVFHILTYSYNFYLGRHMLIAEPHRGFIFGPYWSLTLEEQFYFALPLLVLIVGRKLLMPVLLGITALQLGVYWLFWNPVVLYLRFSAILFGVLLFLARQSAAGAFNLLEPSKLRGVSAFTVSGLLAAGLAAAGTIENPLLCQTVVGLAGVGLVSIASYEKGYGLRSRFLAWLGARSYAIYMTHIPMFRVNLELWNYLARWRGFHLTAMEPSPVIVSAAVLTLLASEMNFRLLERPLIACGRRIASRIENYSERGEQRAGDLRSISPGLENLSRPGSF
jgi:peptidoglycan/LPS O-acetylase OafA/YrhL